MARFFTSDWHLGEDRIGTNGKPNLFYRFFKNVNEQNYTIISELCRSSFKDGDELVHLGDIIYDMTNEVVTDLLVLREKSYPNSKFTLIVGNYDEHKMEFLNKIFDEITEDKNIEIKGREYYLNHYPIKCKDKEFSLTGHIHGLWKVQKNMINVGVDAWHFKPVSEDEIDFCRTACEKYYDNNVFPY
jgi:calcineurin-like phosphoesterase family protein